MSEIPTVQEMENFHFSRTKYHISLVGKYCIRIFVYDSERFNGILERANEHDQTKFHEPEKTPYLYISWFYKCKKEGKDFEIPSDMKDKANEATLHHVLNVKNRHHPEFHCGIEHGLINNKNRDEPIESVIDATKMSDLDIGEMVADWEAVSEERGNTPKNWADKNINVRWRFTDKQKILIYDLIDKTW